MNTKLVERFLKYSHIAGNINKEMNDKDFLLFLNNPDNSFEYKNIPTFNTYKKDIFENNKIDKSIVEANYAVTETGTVIITATEENFRKTICFTKELNIVILSSTLVESLEDIAPFLEKETSDGNSYISFITGASRTADIENELVIGVHGPEIVKIYLITNR